ncbi:unnamed protein product [Lathyrus sativus]|nr:unnamed protein product [Lathyrus sativus]
MPNNNKRYFLIGNQATEPFRVAFDIIVSDDICWISYRDHRDTQSLESSRRKMTGLGKLDTNQVQSRNA